MLRTRLPWLFAALFGIAGPAAAIEVCDLPPRYGLSQAAIAIVRNACNEHRLWQQPFIDGNGRVASLSVTEAENQHLADHGLIAWQRVASYWRDSGTLAPMARIAGASSCMALDGQRYSASDCRGFLIDNPWSAAFVSWVMTQAGVAGFTRSPRHIDYIRAAYQDPGSGPYQFSDPSSEKPAPGDLLCRLRDRDNSTGYTELRNALGRGSAIHWKSHCDIVIAANVGGDRTLYLIGGNVLNTVMLRKLPLDRSGRLLLAQADQPASDASQQCSPANEELCDFNQHDWAALLKLRAEASVLAQPSATTPAATPTPTPAGIPPETPAAADSPMPQPVPAQ
jgi:hypothetical protein